MQHAAKPVSLRVGNEAPSAPRSFTEVKQAVDLATANRTDPFNDAQLLFGFDVEVHNAKPEYKDTWLSVAEKMVKDGLGGAKPILLHVTMGTLTLTKSAHRTFAGVKREVQLMSALLEGVSGTTRSQPSRCRRRGHNHNNCPCELIDSLLGRMVRTEQVFDAIVREQKRQANGKIAMFMVTTPRGPADAVLFHDFLAMASASLRPGNQWPGPLKRKAFTCSFVVSLACERGDLIFFPQTGLLVGMFDGEPLATMWLPASGERR